MFLVSQPYAKRILSPKNLRDRRPDLRTRRVPHTTESRAMSARIGCFLFSASPVIRRYSSQHFHWQNYDSCVAQCAMGFVRRIRMLVEWLSCHLKARMQAASILPDSSSLLFPIQAAKIFRLRLAISLKYVDKFDIRSNGRF